MSEYRDIYNKTWGSEEYHVHSPELAAVDKIAEIARKNGATRIMAMGCGQGRAIKRLLELGFDAYGLDVSDVALSANPDLKDRVRCLDISKLDTQPFGSMDLCYSVDVLEHVHPEHLHGFLQAIQIQNPQWVYLEISTNEDYFGSKLVGEPLHVCIRPASWWRKLIGQYFDVREVQLERESFVGGCAIIARRGCSNPPQKETHGAVDESPSRKQQRFEQNLNAFQARFSKHAYCSADAVRNADPEAAGLRVVPGATGLPIGAVRVGEQWLGLDDQADPRTIARTWARQIKIRSESPMVIQFGFGFGYASEEVLRLIGPSGRLLVVEPYPEVLRSAMENRGLVHLFQDRRFHWVFGVTPEDVRSAVDQVLLTQRKLEECHPVAGQSYAALLAENLVPAAQAATAAFSYALCARKTIQFAGAEWAAHGLRNLGWSSLHPGLESIVDLSELDTAIVVGAGPSLSGSIEFLRRMQDRVPILAADSAVPRLVEAGVHPHLVLAIDRKEAPLRSASRLDPSKTGLVLNEFVHPGYRDLEALFKVTCLQPFWCARLLPEGRRRTWRNLTFVGGTAAEVAVQMGAKTIYLTGLDFAFSPDGSTHVAGALPQELMDIHLNDEWRLQLPGYTQSALRTSNVLRLYLEEFCDFIAEHPTVRFIPVTEGGARIGSLIHVLPDQALDLCGQYPSVDWRSRLCVSVRAAQGGLSSAEQKGRVRRVAIKLAEVCERILKTGRVDEAIAVIHSPAYADLLSVYWMAVRSVLEKSEAETISSAERMAQLHACIKSLMPVIQEVLA